MIPLTYGTHERSPKAWALPQSYIGAQWSGYLTFMGRTRDSSLLENHNFECAWGALRDFEGVEKVCENHWACGWIEWIAIPLMRVKAIECAEEIAEALDVYPVLDEDSYGTKEHEAACELWSNSGLRDRIHYCKRAGVSILQARRDTIGADRLYDLMRDYAAE